MKAITFDIETSSSVPLSRNDLSSMELTIVGVHDSESGEYTSYTKEELPKLWPLIENTDMLIGYNSDFFDIPILNRYYSGDLSKIRSLDLMVEVQKVLGRRLRLQTLAEATLGRGKSGDGLKAIEWWAQGLVEKVRAYCIEDVRITRELFDYAMHNGVLKYKDLRDIRDIKLDTSTWNTALPAPSMTHTLPF
ncbi:ribonuclease H-like domain-containing protein [Patescibacteria group bacterium]|nr:ribonuclease H-like domain-containing protein [Patescibacteria group bacterium]